MAPVFSREILEEPSSPTPAEGYDLANLGLAAIAWNTTKTHQSLIEILRFIEKAQCNKSFEPAHKYPGVTAFCDMYAKDYTMGHAEDLCVEVNNFWGAGSLISPVNVFVLKQWQGTTGAFFQRRHVLAMLVYGPGAMQSMLSSGLQNFSDLVRIVKNAVGNLEYTSKQGFSAMEMQVIFHFTDGILRMLPNEICPKQLCRNFRTSAPSSDPVAQALPRRIREQLGEAVLKRAA